MNFRRLFSAGRMNKDVDERELPQGEYVDAYNVLINSGEDGDFFSVKNSLSTKKLTEIDFGNNVFTIGGFEDKTQGKLYWLVKSDNGCWLLEYNTINNSLSIVLQDNRPSGNGRVLDLHENYRCTSFVKVYSKNGDLLLITDNNIPPLCINIERAKTYGLNGFEKEDIYLIKKPPRFAPTTNLFNTGNQENYLKNKFLSFAYRYKYLDGEYSALSSFSNYRFSPKKFEIDFATYENIGMVNAFNAVRIGFNTGDKRVTDIQLVFKESNSNALYLIETFNKKLNSWGDNELRDFVFSNNKIYTILPEKELYRLFDNVPDKAASLTLIDNIPVFGNYTENYDLVDVNGQKIKIDFEVSLKSQLVVSSEISKTLSSDVTVSSTPINNKISFDFSNVQLKIGSKLSFNIVLTDKNYNVGTFNYTIDFILNRDYTDALDLASDEDFVTFIEEVLTNSFFTNYETTPPENSIIDSQTYFIIQSATSNSITIKALKIVYRIDDTPGNSMDNPANTHLEDSYWAFEEITSLVIFSNETSSSIKTNRSYEIGIKYLEEFNRSTTVLTQPNNTIYIPQEFSIYQNKFRVLINHAPPVFADRYKLVVKQQTLSYQTIYGNVFYEDGIYRWIKLEGENIDKIKKDDTLIVKKDIIGVKDTLIKVKVLDIKTQEEDFISGNNNEDGQDIIEPAGLYVKIKPNGFLVDYGSDDFITDEAHGSLRSGHPSIRLEGFSKVVGSTVEHIEIPLGSTIRLKFISSGRNRGDKTFDKTYTAQSDYANFKEWFDDVLAIELPLSIQENDEDQYTDIQCDYGTASGSNGVTFTGNPADQIYLKVRGITPGNGNVSTGKKGYIDGYMTIRLVDGIIIFETETKDANNEIFYESEQTFEIVNGNHLGNITNQNISSFIPAEVEMDFFNCYVQGNGAESYRVLDGFNKNSLNIDLRPSAVSLEEYKKITRESDLTHGEPYIESLNVNGLNVFNLSTGNFKELDKQYGPIRYLGSRDTDIVVLQHHKASKVLFKKDILSNADGTQDIVAINNILGRQITYLGENGVGNNPESVAVNDYQIYYVNPIQGTPIRLSIDGTTNINYGLVNWWRNLFIKNKRGLKIGGYDAYHNRYIVAIGEEIPVIEEGPCDSSISIINTKSVFDYKFKLNAIDNDIILNYNVKKGSADIVINYEAKTSKVDGANGVGNLTINRSGLKGEYIFVKVTPLDDQEISFDLDVPCPLGIPLKIVSVVLNSPEDKDKNIVNRFRWGTTPFFSSNDVFLESGIAKFLEENGYEGEGKFPLNNTFVNIQSYRTTLESGIFQTDECNSIRYLISENIYTSENINELIEDSISLSLTETGVFPVKTFSGNFLFSRSNINKILYLIWDYTNKKPILQNDSILINSGEEIIINLLGNDILQEGDIITINVEEALHGTAVINSDNTITYTHDGLTNETDDISYTVSRNGCVSTGHIRIRISAETISLYPYKLSYKSSQYTCGDFTYPVDVYVDVQTYSSVEWFNSVNKIWLDEAGTIPAPAGWYVDDRLLISSSGVWFIHWDGTNVISEDGGFCSSE